MKILITGGLGFVGSHLIEELRSYYLDNADITVVDNFTSNVIDNSILANVQHENIETYVSNNDNTFDVIYHLASFVGPAGVLKHGGNIAPTIISQAKILADFALLNNSRIVNVSTSEIYGGGASRESDDKKVIEKSSPRLEYAIGKLAAEITFNNTENLKVVHIRPFNIAGPRQQPDGGFVLPRFVQSALKGDDLTVFDNGYQVRSFTHVKDVARGIMLGAQLGSSGQAYNIGNSENTISIGDLALRVISMTHGISRIEYTSGDKIYGEKYVEANEKTAISDKARASLGWYPTRNLNKIILDTIEFERAKLK